MIDSGLQNDLGRKEEVFKPFVKADPNDLVSLYYTDESDHFVIIAGNI